MSKGTQPKSSSMIKSARPMSRSIVSSVPSRLALPSRGHELGRLVEPHAQSHVDRLHAQPDREMRLAAPGLAVEHQVLRALDETESQEPARACSRREARRS